MHGSSVEAPLLLYEFLPPSQQLNHHQLPSGLPAPLLVADVMGGSDPFLDTPIPPIYPPTLHNREFTPVDEEGEAGDRRPK